MIGFGELRRRASEWKQDLSDVERQYATDWLLKGVFDHADLAARFALRGSSALRYAYSPDYALDASPELTSTGAIDPESASAALKQAAHSAEASGLRFFLSEFKPSLAQFEYVGPLGRRSAAQPHIRLALIPGSTLRVPMRVPLVHRFSDACRASVAAVALDELAAERIVALSNPAVRARDLYDLWFILTQLQPQMNRNEVRTLVATLARKKNIELPAAIDLSPSSRQSLERAWEGALRHLPERPPLEQVERDLETTLGELLS